jgi:hypothetical protein
VITLIASGLSNEEISRKIYVSPSTVKTHAARAMTKLGARDRAQLAVFAYQAGTGPAGLGRLISRSGRANRPMPATRAHELRTRGRRTRQPPRPSRRSTPSLSGLPGRLVLVW